MGGLLFSLVGDRWGRKFVLVATLFLMGFATLAIGLLPTYAQVGVWAPILLVACRLLQGLGAGAEQAGGIVLITETAPDGSRGRLASLVYVGAAAGTALGALVWLLVQRLPEADVESYGWRLVFLSSIVRHRSRRTSSDAGCASRRCSRTCGTRSRRCRRCRSATSSRTDAARSRRCSS